MKSHHPSRLCLGAAFLLLCVSASAFARGREPSQPPPAVKQPSRVPPRPQGRPAQGAGRPGQNQQHLAQWMENHRNLSLPDQQRALESEPGFHELPPQVQQRYRDELIRLYNMNPQQRSRMLDRNEALERMSPPQRQHWRDAVQQLNALPVPRRRLMARAILDLREMPPDQRQQVIDSQPFRAQFSDDERSVLSILLTAEPYPPPSTP